MTRVYVPAFFFVMLLKTIFVWVSVFMTVMDLSPSTDSSPFIQQTSGRGSPKIGTSNFKRLASVKGSKSVSLATFGLEGKLGSDLPALLMAITLNWYSWPFCNFCMVALLSGVSRHSHICHSPP